MDRVMDQDYKSITWEECYRCHNDYKKNIGDKIFIPKMNLIPSDLGLPFNFQRRQFLITLCFAMKINKSSNQTLF